MVPMSAKKSRGHEGFPIRIRPIERQPMKSRLSRAYLQKYEVLFISSLSAKGEYRDVKRRVKSTRSRKTSTG